MPWSVTAECCLRRWLTISDGITAIYNDAFIGCDNIKTMTLPNTVTQINTNPTKELDEGWVVSIDEKCIKKWSKDMVIYYDGNSYTCDNLHDLALHILTNNTIVEDSATSETD